MSQHAASVTQTQADFSRWPLEDGYDNHSFQRTSHTRPIGWNVTISFLPNELISIIFRIGKEDSVYHEAPAIQMNFEILVSHVCSRWRSVALHDSSLWANIHISYRSRSLCYPEAKAYLERSKLRPLSLLLDLRPILKTQPGQPIQFTQDSHNWPFVEAAMTVLLPCHRRWEQLRVCALFPSHLRGVLEYLRTLEAPLLRCLLLECSRQNPYTNSQAGYAAGSVRLFSAGVPMLKDVRMQGFGFHLASPPLASITDLLIDDSVCGRGDDSIAAASWEATRSNLIQSQALTSLTILGIEILNPAFIGNASIEIPSLLHLMIRLSSGGAYINLLSHIIAPQLQSLHLLLSPSSSESQDDTIQKLLAPRSDVLSRNFSGVTKLILSCIDIQHQSTFRLVSRAFPSVTEITLGGLQEGFSSAFLRVLGEVGQPGVHISECWPNLQVLTLRPNIKSKLLHQTLEARKEARKPIYKVCWGSLMTSVYTDDSALL